MNGLIKQIKDWRVRRRNQVDPWEKTRAMGFAAFLTRSTLFYTIWMMTGSAATDYLFDGTIETSALEFRLISFTVGGLILGFASWHQNEGNYKNARLEARIKAAALDETTTGTNQR